MFFNFLSSGKKKVFHFRQGPLEETSGDFRAAWGTLILLWFHMQKTIPELLVVVRVLSDQRFPSYERFHEKVTFQKREFAFSCFFCAFLWSRILLKLLLGVFVIILNILVKTRVLLS